MLRMKKTSLSHGRSPSSKTNRCWSKWFLPNQATSQQACREISCQLLSKRRSISGHAIPSNPSLRRQPPPSRLPRWCQTRISPETSLVWVEGLATSPTPLLSATFWSTCCCLEQWTYFGAWGQADLATLWWTIGIGLKYCNFSIGTRTYLGMALTATIRVETTKKTAFIFEKWNVNCEWFRTSLGFI